MTKSNTVAKMLADLGQTQQAFLDILSRIDESTLYRRPPGEESWTLAESLAHITEARQFWSDEIAKVLATPGAQVGRPADHPGRQQAVKEHGHDSVDALRRRFLTSYEYVVKTLSQISEQDLQVSCEHIASGSLTLAEFIQRFLVEHDRTHVGQAQALLAE
ncbi:MAG TPA: DinB family protein [Anaerolineae bacterium]|nr:DinB family protein [Anaerolineae bacterium]